MTRKRHFVNFKPGGTGAAFNVRVVTRAAKTELAGIQEDGALKIRLKSSPAGDPAANEELIDFLAAQLGVERSRIQIVAGAGGREKIISVDGIAPDLVEEKLGEE